MATTNTRKSTDLLDDGENVTLSKDRSEIAISAAAEIEELCNLMRVSAHSSDDVEISIRGLSLRARELSSIIMGALGDEAEKTPDLAYRLTGEKLETVAA